MFLFLLHIDSTFRLEQRSSLVVDKTEFSKLIKFHLNVLRILFLTETLILNFSLLNRSDFGEFQSVLKTSTTIFFQFIN